MVFHVEGALTASAGSVKCCLFQKCTASRIQVVWMNFNMKRRFCYFGHCVHPTVPSHPVTNSADLSHGSLSDVCPDLSKVMVIWASIFENYE